MMSKGLARPTFSKVIVEDDRGNALLAALMVSMLLAVLALSMSSNIMTDFSMSHDLESQKRALQTADSGNSVLKNSLLGLDLSATLQATTVVPRYINYPEPTPGTDADNYFQRNPLAPLEAMNVDFENLPSPIGTRNATGFLTPAGGVSLGSGARYFAKITDNDDGDGDLTTDVDGIVILRTLAIQRLGAGQMSTYGGTVKNSVSIVETMIEREKTFEFKAGLTLYGPCAQPAQGGSLLVGNSFDVDGYDHPDMTLSDLAGGTHSHVTGGDSAGINAVYDDSGAGDGTGLRDCIYDDLAANQRDNIVGDSSDYGATPSLQDGTQAIRDDPNPDATNLFDATYLMNLIDGISAFADTTIPDGSSHSADMGDDDHPEITYCPGDCTINGTSSGAGMLLVQGRLELSGNLDYRGLILVVGEGEFHESGNVDILGGIFVAKT
ncbi:MAG: hypothetical protein IH917_05155, partial [Acidobacteria bacterium]|nr:hypothetical protein [Acidobacteriota bacterium]